MWECQCDWIKCKEVEREQKKLVIMPHHEIFSWHKHCEESDNSYLSSCDIDPPKKCSVLVLKHIFLTLSLFQQVCHYLMFWVLWHQMTTRKGVWSEMNDTKHSCHRFCIEICTFIQMNLYLFLSSFFRFWFQQNAVNMHRIKSTHLHEYLWIHLWISA